MNSSPAIPQAAITPRCTGSNPAPVVNGLNAVCSASERCFTGNAELRCPTHAGVPRSGGMNTSEMKSSGRMEPFTTAGAASEFGITAAIANPSVQNANAPTASVTSTAGIVCPGTSTS